MLIYGMQSKIAKDAHVIIIGAMKAGTTSLYNYLQSHPEICPALLKEPEFFSENQVHGIRPRGIQVSSYADLWSFDESVHKYALEASTGYTQFPLEPNVPKKIYDYGIKPKLIYIVRNPFSRILSHRSFIKNRAWAWRFDHAHFINVSNYFLQLEQYRKYFPLEDILILDFDMLKDDSLAILQTVYRFLDLLDDYVPEEFEAHNPTRLESKLEKGLRKSKFSTLFNYVPKPLKQYGRGFLDRLPADKSTLTDSERQFIYNELKEDMFGLYHSYGVDVRKWGFDV